MPNINRANIPQGPSFEDNRKAITAVNSDGLMFIPRLFRVFRICLRQASRYRSRARRYRFVTVINIGIGNGK